MKKNNDKFNDQVKRNMEELHKLKEDVKKTDDPKIKQQIEQLYNTLADYSRCCLVPSHVRQCGHRRGFG